MRNFCFILLDSTSVEVSNQYNPLVVVFFIFVLIFSAFLYFKSESKIDFLGEDEKTKKFSEEIQKGLFLEDYSDSLDRDLWKK